MNKNKTMKILRELAPMILIIIAGIVLDRVTKVAAIKGLKYEGNSVTVIKGLFSWTLVYNTGAAWSILSNQMIILYIFTIVALTFSIIFYLKTKSAMTRLALSLIISGALGNFIDRLIWQKVTDFMQFHPFDFPIFNVADILLVCGSILLMIYLLFFESRQKNKDETE